MSKKEKIVLLLFFILNLLNFFAVLALAAPGSDYLNYAQPEQVSAPNLFWELVKIIISLLFVLSIAYLVFQFLNKKNPLFSKGQFIKVIENTFIAPNKSISIVEVGNRFLILGVTEQNITLLTEITDQQIIAFWQEKQHTVSEPNNSFSNYLSAFLEKKIEKDEKIDNGTSRLNNLENYFQKQVEKIASFNQNKESKQEKDEKK